jgi:chemotaxis family two-component system sensor kinase Cph1
MKQMAPGEVAARDPGPDTERFHQFTSTTVHHLREQVRMLNLYAELLREQASPELSTAAIQSLEFVQKGALRLQKLVDGLGEFSAATAPLARPNSTVRLDLPLRQALVNLSSQVKAAGATVSYADLPTVRGDFDRLQVVFQHLLRNALQYRGDGPVTITVTAKPVGSEWMIEVRDNGPGIAPEFHAKIFNLYTRLHGDELPGNGLGLPVCRAIVESHGGTIRIESRTGEGASFLFTLPGLFTLPDPFTLPGQ